MMKKNGPIRVLGESEQECDIDCDSEIIGLEFDILGEPIRLRVSIADEYARLSDIVPLARALSTEVALLKLGKIAKEGEYVPCCKGCSECCNYLVPVSVPEAFRIRDELLAMPTEQGGLLLQSFLDASRTIIDSTNKGCDLSLMCDTGSKEQLSDLSKWYRGLKLPCPFLSDDICASYAQRPIACCEYIVTGSPLICKNETIDKSNMVTLPVSINNVLVDLSSQLEQSEAESMILPLFLPWTQENLERGERTWPAEMMVRLFVEITENKAKEYSAKTEQIFSEVS